MVFHEPAYMSEVIYELTGVHRSNKEVSERLKFLDNLQRYLESKSSKKMRQDELDCRMDLREGKNSGMKNARTDETMNGDFRLFRELSGLNVDLDNNTCYRIAKPLPRDYLPLLSVSRTCRSDTLPIIARTITYDFGSNLNVFYEFPTILSSGALKYLTSVRLLLVEGHIPRMGFDALPKSRKIHIELWPRDPARNDKWNLAWGNQTVQFLDSLDALDPTPIMEWRWKVDCERFKREYTPKGWQGLCDSMAMNTDEREQKVVCVTGPTICLGYETCSDARAARFESLKQGTLSRLFSKLEPYFVAFCLHISSILVDSQQYESFEPGMATPPEDQLSLLPPELRLRIYSLQFSDRQGQTKMEVQWDMRILVFVGNISRPMFHRLLS